MAKLTSPPEPPEPPEHVYVPDEGNMFSTIKVERTTTAFVAIEHPADWTPEQLAAAASRRRGDIADKARWWDADTSTRVPEIVRGEYAPDEDPREPYMLTASDLAAEEPIVVTDAEPTPAE